MQQLSYSLSRDSAAISTTLWFVNWLGKEVRLAMTAITVTFAEFRGIPPKIPIRKYLPN